MKEVAGDCLVQPALCDIGLILLHIEKRQKLQQNYQYHIWTRYMHFWICKYRLYAITRKKHNKIHSFTVKSPFSYWNQHFPCYNSKDERKWSNTQRYSNVIPNPNRIRKHFYKFYSALNSIINSQTESNINGDINYNENYCDVDS